MQPSPRGTAPRARGRPTGDRDATVAEGNSPAGAGTTKYNGVPKNITTGTAPRARGRRADHLRDDGLLGNSPAGAGTTSGGRSSAPTGREQPRGRGDDATAPRGIVAPVGTAPRARGRPDWAVRSPAGLGNSPAGAGTTCESSATTSCPWEQPRGRGDDHLRPAPHSAVQGTAPRARGRHARHRGVPGLGGNSPAGAGTTSPWPAPGTSLGNSPAGAGTTPVELGVYRGRDTFLFTLCGRIGGVAGVAPALVSACSAVRLTLETNAGAVYRSPARRRAIRTVTRGAAHWPVSPFGSLADPGMRRTLSASVLGRCARRLGELFESTCKSVLADLARRPTVRRGAPTEHPSDPSGRQERPIDDRS